MSKLKITQIRSLSGQIEPHRKIMRALGLRKIRHAVLHNDSPQIRGMLNAVHHMVKVEKA